MRIGTAPTLTRQQIENWTTNHLDTAAQNWTAQADKIEQKFIDHQRRMDQPGGTIWTGQAQTTAYDTATEALTTARRQAETLREAASVAATGGQDIQAVQQLAISAIKDAEAQGYQVANNLKVTDPDGKRDTQPIQDFIKWRANNLAATDMQVAQDLHAKAGELQRSSIQALDIRSGPGLPADHTRDREWEYNIDLKSSKEIAAPTHPSAGTIATVDDAWRELHRCFNCSFPIGGAPHDFPKVGDRIPLSVGMGSNGPNLPFPVEVTKAERSANEINIEFKTLPGHVDGEGSLIQFRFYENQGELHLGIRGLVAHGPGSIEDFPRNLSAPLERTGYTFIAHSTWQPYIDQLTANIAASKGIPLVQVKG